MHIHADDGDAKKRRRRKRSMLGLLLFSPWKRLKTHIAMATHDIDDYFDRVDMALGTKAVKDALTGEGLDRAFMKLIGASTVTGYDDGGAIVGKKAGPKFIKRAFSEAENVANEVADQMQHTTKQWLKENPDHPFALSKDRAERAAQNEAAKAYYDGMHQALWGEGCTKEWVCLGDDPCDDCLDNEDAGQIAVEDVFPSGDYAPLAHLNCLCVLSVHGPLEGA